MANQRMKLISIRQEQQQTKIFSFLLVWVNKKLEFGLFFLLQGYGFFSPAGTIPPVSTDILTNDYSVKQPKK